MVTSSSSRKTTKTMIVAECLSPMAFSLRKRSNSSYRTNPTFSSPLVTARFANGETRTNRRTGSKCVHGRKPHKAARSARSMLKIDGYEYGLGFNFELFTHSTTFFRSKSCLVGQFQHAKISSGGERGGRENTFAKISSTMGEAAMGITTTKRRRCLLFFVFEVNIHSRGHIQRQSRRRSSRRRNKLGRNVRELNPRQNRRLAPRE